MRRGRSHDRARCGDIADTQTGREDLGEGADIRHDAGRIDARERQHGPPLEVELMIVVLFDDREAIPLREGQQIEAPRRRQRHGRGKLVMWGRVEGAQAACTREPFHSHHVQPLRVERHSRNLRSLHSERLDGRLVTQFLDDDDVARTDERSRQQRNPHLTSPRHAHLVG
jgi:hypothetical protein